jgi:hypothetical protein
MLPDAARPMLRRCCRPAFFTFFDKMKNVWLPLNDSCSNHFNEIKMGGPSFRRN